MEDFRILEPDPYNNSTGSASLILILKFAPIEILIIAVSHGYLILKKDSSNLKQFIRWNKLFKKFKKSTGSRRIKFLIKTNYVSQSGLLFSYFFPVWIRIQIRNTELNPHCF